ncbi:hypothetical protein [Lacicoccus alkaliphilus]|uniref:hypothetical protein n=1 Tax=Lacicoccus alkaliphilus TaxID=148453 RepID=UPI0039F0A7FC
MKDEGFLLADSLLSLMIFVMITSILLPAALLLVQYDVKTKEQLDFNRHLYIVMNGYEDFDEFKDQSKGYVISQGEICDKDEKDLCIVYKN